MTAVSVKESVVGAPYVKGDPVAVEYDGRFTVGAVKNVTRSGSTRFGLAWTMRVQVSGGVLLWVACDDNGRNRTRGSQVMPYDGVEG